MTELFANNASSTLNGAINNVVTTLVVTSAASFPGSGNFRLILGTNPASSEIVLVTGVSGTTFTVVRGQESTTATSWPDLTPVTHILTAASLGVATTGGGDLSGSVQSATVSKINGSSVPAGGSLTTGNVLQVSGASALTYAPVNLAGGANFVTGSLPTGNQAAQSMGGDVSGTTAAASVVKIRGKDLASSLSSVGSAQDGYTLTWVNGSTDWEAKPTVVTRVQNGANYSGTYDIIGFSVNPTTSSTTFINAATFEFDPTILTAASGTRTIALKVIAETTSPQITIQLYNYTAVAVVTGSTLTTSSTVPVSLSTGDLSANLTNGNAIYQVQIQMASGGTPTDRVTLDLAKLRIVWS